MARPSRNNLTPPTPVAGIPGPKGAEILLAAYQKHATELLAIESSQEKFLTLILGFYSAVATIVAGLVKDHGGVVREIAWPVVAVAVVIGAYAWVFSKGRNDARYNTRCILVNVEAALGFYETGAYVKGSSLYAIGGYRHYPEKSFLNHSVWIVPVTTAALIGLMLYLRYWR